MPGELSCWDRDQARHTEGTRPRALPRRPVSATERIRWTSPCLTVHRYRVVSLSLYLGPRQIQRSKLLQGEKNRPPMQTKTKNKQSFKCRPWKAGGKIEVGYEYNVKKDAHNSWMSHTQIYRPPLLKAAEFPKWGVRSGSINLAPPSPSTYHCACRGLQGHGLHCVQRAKRSGRPGPGSPTARCMRVPPCPRSPAQTKEMAIVNTQKQTKTHALATRSKHEQEHNISTKQRMFLTASCLAYASG